MLPMLVGSGEGDGSAGRGKAGGRSLGLGGATLLALLYAGNVGFINVGFDISGLRRSPCFGGNGTDLFDCYLKVRLNIL